MAICSKVKTLSISIEITNTIAHILGARDFASFTFVSFLNMFRQNIIATLKKDISAKVQIKINITSGLSKKAESLLLIIIKYIGDILLIE